MHEAALPDKPAAARSGVDLAAKLGDTAAGVNVRKPTRGRDSMLSSRTCPTCASSSTKEGIEFISFYVSDIDGRFRNVTIPAANFTEKTVTEGIGIDASSLGFATVDRSDMLIKPDLGFAFLDPGRAGGQGALFHLRHPRHRHRGELQPGPAPHRLESGRRAEGGGRRRRGPHRAGTGVLRPRRTAQHDDHAARRPTASRAASWPARPAAPNSTASTATAATSAPSRTTTTSPCATKSARRSSGSGSR